MLKWLSGLLTGGPYYVRINRERIAVRDVSTGDSFECKSLLGMDSADRVVSVGFPASSDAVRKLNPFDHPRVLVDDFQAAEKIFTHAIRNVAKMKFLRPSPIVVVHPDLELEGGLAPIEVRVLYELADNAGARKAYIHYGSVLSDEGVRELAGEA